MKQQHPINLLPEHLVASNHAATICKRYIIACAVVIAMFVISIAHAQLSIVRAKNDLELARNQANDALAIRNRAGQQSAELSTLNNLLLSQSNEAFHMQSTLILASLINNMPESVTLDDLILSTNQAEHGSRTLQAKLRGFAATDADVSQFAVNLEDSTFYNNINLDYTSSRIVRSRPARDFQISFHINLDAARDFASRISHKSKEHVNVK
ncbi:MAG: PilN domain-containing protein [Planctomycetes bacterium]|nr:PilN domain-containing protein [Planctomycetota bacterium]